MGGRFDVPTSAMLRASVFMTFRFSSSVKLLCLLPCVLEPRSELFYSV